MAYRVRLAPLVVNQIRGWNLPDKILEEVWLYLHEVLPADLENNLSDESEPFDRFTGMKCRFTRRDHHVRGREHHFIFRVFFTQDEEALYIDRGDYDLENAP